MRRIFLLLILTVCSATVTTLDAKAQSPIGSSSCLAYRDATDPAQLGAYAAYLQAFANAGSPDPRYTVSDAALISDAKKIRDWCGKNSKKTYGEAVAAILGSASSNKAPAVQAPQQSQEPTSCRVGATRGCAGCSITCNGGQQAVCREPSDSGIKNDDGTPECAMHAWCYCKK